MLAHVRPWETEKVGLEEAFGRRLGETVYAAHDVPHFRRSALDGFALRAGDSSGAAEDSPVLLEVTETVACGALAQKPLRPGQAVRIMTGAAVPDEADTVIMFEQTDSLEKEGVPYAAVKKEMKPGDNVTPVGFEMKEGERLLEAGRLVGPGESALLAMFGHASVRVYKRPRVAVFATGTELLRVDEPLEPGRIRNSNGFMIAAQVRQAGAVPHLMETVPDDVELAKRVILAAFDEYDAVVTTGGVSVGDYDILYDLTNQWEGRLLFNKVAMRPGSPTTVGVWNGKLLFALSGNPGASFVGFELFVRPALLGLQGVAKPHSPEHTAILDADYNKGDKFAKYLRGSRYMKDGRLYAKLAGIDASSATVSIRDSDCLIVIPPGEDGMKAGGAVRVIPLGPWSESEGQG